MNVYTAFYFVVNCKCKDDGQKLTNEIVDHDFWKEICQCHR